MRKIFVILSGVYLLGVALFLLFPIVMLMINYSPTSPQEIWVGIAYNLAQLIWIAVTAVGILLMKNWARVSLFVLSGFAFLGGLGLIVTAMIGPKFMGAEEMAQTQTAFVWIIGVAVVFLIAIPVFFLIFFNSRGVKELFNSKIKSLAEGAVPSDWSLLPLGYKIIVVLCSFSVVSILIALFFQPVNMKIQFGPMLLEGMLANSINLIFLALYLFVVIGLIKKLRSAWFVLFFSNAFLMILCVVNIISINEKMFSEITSLYAQQPLSIGMLRLVMSLGVISPAIICIYAWLKRGTFLFVNKV